MKVQTGFLFETLEHDGQPFRHILYVPRNYDTARAWPLIVFLHGYGECGLDGVKPMAEGLPPAITHAPEEWPFLVVCPQKPEYEVQWEEYDAAVMAALEDARRRFNVDAARLYMTGLSQGGHGTWTIGANHPDLWAAIAPVCGYATPALVAAALRDTPIWSFHGEEDAAVPVSESIAMDAALRAEGGSPKLTVYPGVGHNSWDAAYRTEGLAAWFLAYAR